MDQTHVIKALGLINKDLYALQKKREAHLKMLAEMCPVKIGDTVKVTEYSYQGQDMKVVHIKTGLEGFGVARGYYWKVTGQVLKKDGTPGKNHGHTRIIIGKEQ